MQNSVLSYTYTCTSTSTSTCTYTYTHIHIYIYTYTHIHIYTYPPTPLLWLRGRRKGSVKHWLPCLLAISPTRQASSHVPIPIFVCSGFESRKPLRCVRARPSIRHVPTCWGSAVLPLAVRATKAYRWAISPTPHACFASNHVPNQCLPKLRAAPSTFVFRGFENG